MKELLNQLVGYIAVLIWAIFYGILLLVKPQLIIQDAQWNSLPLKRRVVLV